MIHIDAAGKMKELEVAFNAAREERERLLQRAAELANTLIRLQGQHQMLQQLAEENGEEPKKK